MRRGVCDAAATLGLVGHWSASGEQLHCASLVLYILFIILKIFFSFIFLSY